MEREEGEVASWHTRQEEGFWRFPRSEVEDGLGEVERLCEGAGLVGQAVGDGLDF